MRRQQTKQTFKLQLLALVIALAILWYSLNPAPNPIKRYKPEGEPPDQKRPELKPRLQRADTLAAAFNAFEMDVKDTPLTNEEEDDFEWPEFIDG